MVPNVLQKKSENDPWQNLIHHLRKKGPEVRDAVFEGHRVDFFSNIALLQPVRSARQGVSNCGMEIERHTSS
eukprot:3567008-Pyramimonas_sp.AAC.1